MRYRCVLLATIAIWIACVSPAAAATPEEFIDSAFPYIAGEGGAPLLPAGTKAFPDRPGHRYLKVPKGGGGTAHLFATGPFAFEEGGEVRSVNTDLVAAAGGWQPQSVPFDVVIPQDLADGIVWRDAESGESVRIYPQNISNAPGRLYEGSTDTVIYDDVWNRTHMTVAVTTHGIKDHIILTQANGVPNQFKFRVDRPAGATTSLTSDGGVRVISSAGVVLAELPAPVARDRDHQEFAIWYEVASHSSFDVITLKYDTSPITAEGTTVTFEAPFDLDPTIYSGTLVHGENAFRETSLNAYTVSDFNDGNLKVSLLTWPEYPAGKFARWWITPPPAGSRWYSFSARVEGRVGQGQQYTLTDDTGLRYGFGPAAVPGTYFAQDVSFTPQGDINHRIQATQTITPQYDYYGQLTNPVVIYEDLVDPTLIDLRPNGTTVTASQVTLNLGMSDGQSGCGSITVTLSGPVAPIGTKTGTGCSLAPVFDLRTEGTHRIDVILTDRSGRTTTASGTFTFDSPVDPPLPPVVDGLNFANDEAWTNDNTTFSASWNPAAGATSYQLCFTATAPCAPDDRWTGFGAATSGIVGGYAFAHGQTVFACVRSINAEGVRTVPRCSNGTGVDLQPPTSPGHVHDGLVAGVDSDRSISTFEAGATWPNSTDPDSGVAGYETCVTYSGASCDESGWFEREPAEGLAGLSTIERFTLELGRTYRVCVRAYDQVDNTSIATCSNGQRVVPSQEEIEDNIVARMQLGLPASQDRVESILRGEHDGTTTDRFGFTATEQEAAFLTTSFAAQDAAFVAIDRFAERAGSAFGGSYVDSESGRVIIGLARPVPHLVGSLLNQSRASCRNAVVRTRGIRSRAQRGGKKVRSLRCWDNLLLRRVRYSERVLELIQTRAFDQDRLALSKLGIQVNAAAIDYEANVLRVGVEPNSAIDARTQESLLNKYYVRLKRDKRGPIRAYEREIANPAARRARPTRVNFFGRYSLVSGLIQGTYINEEPFFCSTGFVLPSLNRMVSADHCYEQDGVKREVYSAGRRFGLTGPRYTARNLDLRWIDVDSDVKKSAAIFRRLPAPVVGPPQLVMTIAPGAAVRALPGQWVCRSARSDGVFTRTGQSCAKVKTANERYRLEGYPSSQTFIGHTARSDRLHEGQPSTPRKGRFVVCGGDSGGPIYKVVGSGYGQARMVGIASASSVDVNAPPYPKGECGLEMTFAMLQRAGY